MSQALGIIGLTAACVLFEGWLVEEPGSFSGPDFVGGLVVGLLLRDRRPPGRWCLPALLWVVSAAAATILLVSPIRMLWDLLGNLIGGVAIAALAAHWTGTGRLPERPTIRHLIVLTTVLAPVQAAIATAVAAAVSIDTHLQARSIAIEWLSHWLGVVLIVPIVILWPRPVLSGHFAGSKSRIALRVGLLAGVGLTAILFFSSEPNSLLSRSWPLSGLLILVAIRFRPLLVSVLSLIYGYCVVWFTLRGFGPFIDPTIDPVWSFAAMSLTLGSIATAALILTLVLENQREIEGRLRESLRFANAIFERSPVAIQVFDKDGVSMRMNESQRKFLGVPSRDYGVGAFNVLTDPLMIANRASERFRRVYAGETLYLTGLTPELNLPENTWEVNPDDDRWFDYLIYPLVDEAGRVDAVVSFLQDTTLRTRAEESLRRTSSELEQSQALLRSVIDNTPCLISARDLQQKYLVMNTFQASLFGTTPANAIGRSSLEISGRSDSEQSVTHNRLVLESGDTRSYDEEITDAEGRTRNWHTVRAPLMLRPPSRPLDDGDPEHVLSSPLKISGVVSISVDITSRKQDEEVVRSSLNAKDTLLREIHHRVKNNLAVIIGLLGLQIRRTPEPATRTILQESQNRIGSMSVVHELLYRSNRLSGIDLPEYVRELSNNLLSSYSVIRDRISLTSDVGGVTLNLDTAIPFGLILNELISNSLKHAFPDQRRGNVRVSVVSGEDSMVTLTVADDGIGFAGSESMFDTGSLGMRLVRNLTQQIRGRLRVRGERGGCFEISFPNPERRTPS